MVRPINFYDEEIQVEFVEAPTYEKSPHCPDAFTWRGQRYVVAELLEEWRDFTRRGRFARNMQPAHASRAGQIGSWGVGRYHFRLRVEGGRIFELYYDRAPKEAGDKKGHWWMFREWGGES